LARPDVGFFLTSGGRRTMEAPPVDSLAARVYQLFGRAMLEGLEPVEGGSAAARVSGFVSRPATGAPGRPSVRFFVNGRPVRDRGLSRAVAEAYRWAGAGERPYEAILAVEVPLDMVDVNVHPAKTEVRFADPRGVWRAVEQAVLAAISSGSRQRGVRVEGLPGPASSWTPSPDAVSEGYAQPWPPAANAGAAPAPVAQLPVAGPEAAVLVPLGQHRQTYIVATDGDELVLVDQHTAHERVRFERVMAELGTGAAESQLLLVPLVFTPSPAVRPLLEAQAPLLRGVGYEVEEFGGAAVRITAVPAVMPGGDHGATLLAILRDLAEREDGSWAVSAPAEKVAATVACHSSVRAGQALAREPMARLLADLLAARQPGLCPHGRPTMVRVPQAEVARWFGRTGWRRQ
ncbi:MAG TPA: hypothetical protein VFO85_06800, partial [Vicinamibacteria bacterium]|nr:hypothetical protein [Vicinamibacteria bacterium]